MRTISLKGKTLTVDYCGIGYMGMLKMQLHDSRKLSDIAPDMENAEEIILTEDGDQSGRFTGYTQLRRLEYVDGNSVIVILSHPGVVE